MILLQYLSFESLVFYGIFSCILFVQYHFSGLCLCVYQVFYYHESPYPPSEGRFKDHVEWSGDVSKKDVSITLNQVPPTFNGTYTCQVRNRPDVHGSNGEIVLRVVNKGQTANAACLTNAGSLINTKPT